MNSMFYAVPRYEPIGFTVTPSAVSEHLIFFPIDNHLRDEVLRDVRTRFNYGPGLTSHSIVYSAARTRTPLSQIV